MKKLALILALAMLGEVVLVAKADAFPVGWFLKRKKRLLRADSGVAEVQPIELTDTALRYAFLQYGQSPAGTSGSASALSTTQPYDNQRISSTTLADLVETTNETVLSSSINQITSLRLAENDLIGFTRFATDTAIAAMRDPGDTIYDQAVTQGADMVTAAATARVTAMHFLQGESDVGVNTRAGYAADMATLRSSMESSLRANGSLESQGLAMFFWQTPGWTNYSATANDVILAQLDRHIDGDSRFFLTGPAYYLTFTDAVHTNAASKQHYGQQAGKALEFLWQGVNWEPLRPRSIVRDGDFARAYFIVPCLRYPGGERCSASPPLELDTTVVSDRTFPHLIGTEGIYSGFRYIDENTIGIKPRIETVAVAGTCSECASDEWRVDIEMSSAPRSGSYIAYADIPQTGTAVGCTGHGLGNGCNAAGNLRDTDETAGWTGSYSLNNWSVAFQHAITSGVAPSQLSQLANASSMSITGTNYWSVPDAPALDFTTEFSWFMLYNATTQVANNIIMSHATSGGSQAFILRQDSADTTDIVWQFSSTSNFERCTGCNMSTGVTYCLAGSYNGARAATERARIFLGRPGQSWSQPASSTTGTIPTTMAADTAAFRFGFTSANAVVTMDENMIWNVALTSGQLEAICNGFAQDLAPDVENTTDLPVPLAWWRHDGDASTTVTDHISGTYNGSTSGSPTRGGDLAIP